MGEYSIHSGANVLLAQPVGQRVPQVTPDIGLGFLATSLRNRGHRVDLVDCVCEGFSQDDFARYLRANRFDVVGIKVFSTDLESTRQMLANVRLENPKAVTVIGGPHPSGSPEDVLLDVPEADYAFRGEGENGLVALIEHLAKNDVAAESLAGIPGLIFREDDAIHVNAPDLERDLERLGIPAWDLIDPRKYERFEKLWIFQKRRTVASLQVVRGCPFACAFCACHTITGRVVRFRSVELVMKELRILHEDYGVREFQIIDDFFTAKRSYVMEFCAALEREGLDMVWCCPHGLRVDSLDAELLRTMEGAGCYGTSVGIESGSQRILDFVNKRITPDLVREKLQLIAKETDWITQGAFILGFPTETREEILETIDFAASLPLHCIVMTPFKVYRGTALYNYLHAQQKTAKVAHSVREAYVVDYAPDGMTQEELAGLIRKAYWRFFSNPSRVLSLLRHLHSPAQLRMLLGKLRLRMLPEVARPDVLPRSVSANGDSGETSPDRPSLPRRS